MQSAFAVAGDTAQHLLDLRVAQYKSNGSATITRVGVPACVMGVRHRGRC